MSYNHKLPKKVSLVPKKHHGFQFFLFLLGVLLPPLAVAARFGIGSDFFINVFLCICGYFPCHIHNFYIQNIRNNTNRARTPKWAIKYGLVDNSDRERRAKKNMWAKRFDERNAHSTHIGQSLEDGEEGANYDPVPEEDQERRRNEGLWTRGEEEYYNEDEAPNQRKWHYPANFEGAVGDGRSYSRTESNTSGDRWERTRAARDNTSLSDVGASTYPPAGSTDDDVPEWGRDYGSKGRRSATGKNKKSKKSAKGSAADWVNKGNYVQDVERDDGWGNGDARSPSSARGGSANGPTPAARQSSRPSNGEPNWDHEF